MVRELHVNDSGSGRVVGEQAASARIDAARAASEAKAGDELYAVRQLDAALAHYAEAVRLAPDNDQFLASLAICEYAMGRRDAAIAHLEAAVALNPRSSN